MAKKNLKENNLSDKIYKIIHASSFLFFLYAAGVILPLYYRNAYYDIMDVKAELFFILMKILLPFLIAVIILKICRKKRHIDFLACSILYLLTSSFVSAFFSYSKADAFSGRQGWYVGYFTILCLSLMILTFKDEDRPLCSYVNYPLYLVCLFEFLLTISDAMDLDLLSMRENLDITSHFAYFGTIGNSNWYVGYLSLFVPLFLSRYLSSEKKTDTVFFFLTSLTGLISSILIGADGIYLSMGIAALILAMQTLDGIESLKRTSFLFLVFSLVMFFIRHSALFASFFTFYDSIGLLLFDSRVLIITAVLSVMLFSVSLFADKEKYLNRKKYIVISVMLILLICAVFVLSEMISFRGDSLDNYRFELWRISLKQFDRFDLFHKLFGLGPELLRNVYASMYSKYGIVYTVSHSESIQVLLTMGLSGLLAWSFCWISLLYMFARDKACFNKEITGFYAGLFAYFAQSFVNSATIPNLCILALFRKK